MSGITVKKSGVPIDLQTAFDNADGTPYAGGVTLRLFELQDDHATFFGFDFDTSQFTDTPTYPTLGAVSVTVNGQPTAYSTAQAPYTAFTVGRTYIAEFHTAETPPRFDRQRFQYGGLDGDPIAAGASVGDIETAVGTGVGFLHLLSTDAHSAAQNANTAATNAGTAASAALTALGKLADRTVLNTVLNALSGSSTLTMALPPTASLVGSIALIGPTPMVRRITGVHISPNTLTVDTPLTETVNTGSNVVVLLNSPAFPTTQAIHDALISNTNLLAPRPDGSINAGNMPVQFLDSTEAAELAAAASCLTTAIGDLNTLLGRTDTAATVATIDTLLLAVQSALQAVKQKTDNLPADPASNTQVATAKSSADAAKTSADQATTAASAAKTSADAAKSSADAAARPADVRITVPVQGQ